MSENVYSVLRNTDMKEKIKEKNGLKYLPWSSVWSKVKENFPDATFKVYPQTMDDGGNTRPWHDDGRSGWVEVGVTIGGVETIEMLPIMDFKNKALPAENITSMEANKSIKRCLVKAVAIATGLGIYLYEGEEMPEATSKAIELQDEIMELVKKKCALSDAAKLKVGELCKAAEKAANPEYENEEVSGNPKNIDNVDILEKLKRQILAVRK